MDFQPNAKDAPTTVPAAERDVSIRKISLVLIDKGDFFVEHRKGLVCIFALA